MTRYQKAPTEMTGNPSSQVRQRSSVSRRRCPRFLELANAAEADKGRISIALINRTMLDEGVSVEEYRAAVQRAIAEGLVEMHASGAYVIFTQLGAERFA